MPNYNFSINSTYQVPFFIKTLEYNARNYYSSKTDRETND